MNEKLTKVKSDMEAFYKKHKKKIIFAGGCVLGVGVGYIIKRPEVREVIKEAALPAWVDKWTDKCDRENLLYENGNPVFADDTYNVIYRDAIADGCEQYFIDDGYEVIDREEN